MASRGRRIGWFGAILILLAAAWLAGLAWFAATMPTASEDSPQPTDAIVVLTGGRGRIEEGVALLRRGLARKLFISGVERALDVPAVLHTAHLDPAPSDSAIALGYEADNTASNADEAAAWMRTEGFKSMRLVTASYHMRRSLMEFRHAMPGVVIVAHPVLPEALKHDRWWVWPGTAQLIAVEYVKYLLAALSLALEPAEGA